METIEVCSFYSMFVCLSIYFFVFSTFLFLVFSFDIFVFRSNTGLWIRRICRLLSIWSVLFWACDCYNSIISFAKQMKTARRIRHCHCITIRKMSSFYAFKLSCCVSVIPHKRAKEKKMNPIQKKNQTEYRHKITKETKN